MLNINLPLFFDIRSFFGLYTYSFFFIFIQCFVCFLLFTIFYKKKNKYWLKVAISFVAGLALVILLGQLGNFVASFNINFLTQSVYFILTLLMYISLLFPLLFTINESKTELLKCWGIMVISKNLIGEIYATLEVLSGTDITTNFNLAFLPNNTLLNIAVLMLFHCICFFAIAYFYNKQERILDTKKNVIILTSISVIYLIANSILNMVAKQYYTVDHNLTIVLKVFTVLINTLLLIMEAGFLNRNKLAIDLLVTEQLLNKEKSQYATNRANIDQINTMVHDLKHVINDVEKKLTEDELSSLKNAIELYDSTIKTGNKTLDAILYEKKLLCDQNHINFTVLANGTLLDFMSSTHLYSLFTNSIDNAVNACSKCEENKKLIGLSIYKNDENTVIEIYNYFNPKEELDYKKTPEANKHGYGINSMQYIVKQYKGKMEVNKKDDVFTLTITF